MGTPRNLQQDVEEDLRVQGGGWSERLMSYISGICEGAGRKRKESTGKVW